MRLLANENFPGETIEALRSQGHDVKWIRTEAPGSKDHAVLAMANTENRVLVTFDKDFGELAFRWGLKPTTGIILFRIPPISSSYITRKVIEALNTRSEWVGFFSVVEEARIRAIPLP